MTIKPADAGKFNKYNSEPVTVRKNGKRLEMELVFIVLRDIFS